MRIVEDTLGHFPAQISLLPHQESFEIIHRSFFAYCWDRNYSSKYHPLSFISFLCWRLMAHVDKRKTKFRVFPTQVP